jgi:hypothetical protein
MSLCPPSSRQRESENRASRYTGRLVKTGETGALDNVSGGENSVALGNVINDSGMKHTEDMENVLYHNEKSTTRN